MLATRNTAFGTLALIFAFLIMPSAIAASFSKTEKIEIQYALQSIEYLRDTPNGKFGRRTNEAIRQFQHDFGFRATGRLTSKEAEFLVRLPDIVSKTSLVKVGASMLAPNKELPDAIFSGSSFRPDRNIFSSGPHYLAVRIQQAYNNNNQYRKSDYERKNAKVREWFKRAELIAARSNNLFSRALLQVDNLFKQHDPISVIIPALNRIVTQGELNSYDPFYVSRVFASFDFHFKPEKCSTDAYRLAMYPLAIRALGLFNDKNTNFAALGKLVGKLIKCAPDGALNNLHDLYISLGRSVNSRAYAIALRQKALWAQQQGKPALSKELFIAMHKVILSDVPGGYAYFDTSSSVSGDTDFQILMNLGLESLVDYSIQEVLTEVRSMTNKSWVFISSMQEFAASLDSIGKYREMDEVVATTVDDGGLYLGYHAVASELWEGGKRDQALSILKRIIPRAQRQGTGAGEGNMRIALAGYLVKKGDYRDAEKALNDLSIRLPKLSNREVLKSQAQRIRSKLLLSKSQALPPAVAFVTGFKQYILRACQVNGNDPNLWRIKPELDYLAISNDPSYAAAVRRVRLLDTMLACPTGNYVIPQEYRLVCTFMAQQGRRADFRKLFRKLIAQRTTGTGYYSDYLLVCGMGLASANRLEWVTEIRTEFEDLLQYKDVELLYFATLQPSIKKTWLAKRFKNRPAPDNTSWDEDRLEIEKSSNDPELPKLVKELRATFLILNSGASANNDQISELTKVSYNLGLGYESLGLYTLAEVFYGFDREFVIQKNRRGSAVDLVKVLYDRQETQTRLAFGRLNYKRGAYDEAKGFVYPIVNATLELLKIGDLSSRGALQQWSVRLRGFFELYLKLNTVSDYIPENPSTFLAAQQYLHAASSGASVANLQARLASRDPQLARQYQDTRRKLRLAFSGNETGARQQSAVKLQSDLQSLEERIKDVDPDFFLFGSNQIKSVEEVMKWATEKSSSVLIISQLDDRSILSFIDGSGVRIKSVMQSRRIISDKINSFRNTILGGGEMNAAQSYGLYNDLLGWAIGSGPVPPRLHIVIDGSFASLPFGALFTKREGGPSSYLGRLSAMTLSPSVSALFSQSIPRASATARKPFFGIGNPDFKTGNRERRVALLGTTAFQVALPETEAEVRFLALSLGANPLTDTLVGADASEASISMLNRENKLSEYNIISFATHGILSSQSGKLQEPGLVLSLPKPNQSEDGILTASEIYELRLNASLVILSACNTGTIETEFGLSGLSELSQAFFYAGARALMITHWEVDSGAAAELVGQIARIRSGRPSLTYAEALRISIDSIFRDSNLASYRQPKFWASHFLLKG